MHHLKLSQSKEKQDLTREKTRVEGEGINIVWNADREEEGIHAKAIHLHPRDVGGAILSIDSMAPTEAWLWASPNWEKNVRTEVSNFLNGVHIPVSYTHLTLPTNREV